MRDYLFSLTNKPELLDNSIIHKPLLQYMEHASHSDILEMIGFMQEHVVRILHSKDGSKVALLCIAYGRPKDRKITIKTFKGYVTKICKEEFGHRVMLASFTYVDDTVLVINTILKEMIKDAKELMINKYGRLCFLAILKGITKTYFPPPSIALFQPKTIPNPENPTEEIPTSKKPDEKRKEELIEGLVGPLISILSDPEVVYKMITNVFGWSVLTETLELAKKEEDKKKLVDGILSWVNFTPEKSVKKYHPLEEKPVPKEDLAKHPVAYLALKRIVTRDHEMVLPLLEKLSPNIEEYATHKNGSEVILSLIKNEKTRQQVIDKVLPHLEKLKQIDEKEVLASKHIVLEIENEKNK